MPYQRPERPALIESLRESLRTAFISAGRPIEAFVRRTVPWVLTHVWGDALHHVYGLLAYAHRQILPSTADGDYLRLWGEVFGVPPLPAASSSGTLTFTGVNTTPIPSGTQVTRQDGRLYATTAPVTISGGTATAPAEAVEGGAAGNLEVGASLSLVTPIGGVNDAVTAASGWDTGVDAETTEQHRDRILRRIQRPPQGGAAVDYPAWARLVAGVTRVWVQPLGRGAGTVDVYFLHEGGTGIGIPTSGQVADVQAALDDNRPVTANVLAIAPAELPVAFTLSISPDNSATRQAVETELDALFLARAGDGGTIFVSDYWAALAGLLEAALTSFSIASPTTDTVVAVGEVAVRGTITWV